MKNKNIHTKENNLKFYSTLGFGESDLAVECRTERLWQEWV